MIQIDWTIHVGDVVTIGGVAYLGWKNLMSLRDYVKDIAPMKRRLNKHARQIRRNTTSVLLIREELKAPKQLHR